MSRDILIGGVATVLLVGGIIALSNIYGSRERLASEHAQLAAVGKGSQVQSAQSGKASEEIRDARLLNALLRQEQKENGQVGVANVRAQERQLQVAQRRASAMKALAKENPREFLANAFSTSERAKLPKDVQGEVEMKTKVKGAIDVLHLDDFSNAKNSRFEYHLRSGGKRLEVYFAESAPAMLSGSLVEVEGYQLGDTVVSVGGSESVTILQAEQPESVGTQNTLIILITSPGLPSTPPREEVRNSIFTGAFQQYYQEQSYGKTSFTGQVTDWISVPAADVSWCGMPDLEQADVKNYIIQNGINLSQYGRVMFVNNGLYGGCNSVGKYDNYFNGGVYRLSKGWTGWANSNGYNNRTGMNSFDYVLAHEMGHGLGVMHANSWDCTGPSLDTNCSHIEYGNSYDVMGTGAFATHFNAFYKDTLGWLDPADKVTITRSGTYRLAPLEAQSGVRAGIIRNPALPDASTQPMYLEYRKPIGFDSAIQSAGTGIHINQVIVPYTGAFPMTRFMNLSYPQDWNNGPRVLLPGAKFTWSSRGISVGSLTAGTSTATFGVTVGAPVCNRVGIAVDGAESPTTVVVGSDGSSLYQLTNNDTPSCASSSISFAVSISGVGWTIQNPNLSVTLAPGESTQSLILFTPPSSVTPGAYTLTTTITDTTHSRTYTFNKTITVVAPPTITGILPTRGVVGQIVTLSGTGFAILPESNFIYIAKTDTSTPLYVFVSATTDAPDQISFTFPTTLPYWDGNDFVSTSTPPGTYSVRLIRVSDQGVSNAIPFDVNLPPTANAGPDRTIRIPTSSVTIGGAGVGGNDPDGTIVSRRWTYVPGGTGTSTPTVTNSTATYATFSNLKTVGTYIFRLRVTDDSGTSASDGMMVRVYR